MNNQGEYSVSEGCITMLVNDLVVEVTRRCNLECQHCLRGDVENVDFDVKYFETFVQTNDISEISTITFSGGEPLMRPKIIKDIIECCKENKVDIFNFYIATNGFFADPEVINVLVDLYTYCSENEVSGVVLSRTLWHDNPPYNSVKRLKALAFYKERAINNYGGLIAQGRMGNHGREISPVDVNGIVVEKYDDTIHVYEPIIYLNVFGELVLGCDFSYESQKKYKVGNVETPLVDVLKIKSGVQTT